MLLNVIVVEEGDKGEVGETGRSGDDGEAEGGIAARDGVLGDADDARCGAPGRDGVRDVPREDEGGVAGIFRYQPWCRWEDEE